MIPDVVHDAGFPDDEDAGGAPVVEYLVQGAASLSD
jgi:hypothetical protein